MVCLGPGVELRLVPVQADVGDFDDVLQLPGLLLHLGGQEERGGRHRVAVEAGERVEHVEALHVHDRSVDAQLGPVLGETGHVLFKSSE